MKDFGAIMRGIGDVTLENIFGAEYIALDKEQTRLVLQDLLEVSENERITPREYYRRIGEGNLHVYAEMQVVRFEHGWKE